MRHGAQAGEESVVPEHGTIIGDYRLQRRLGSGGEGEVWLGWHLDTEMPAAIKVLNDPPRFDGDQGTQFDREWRAIARLSHPNIVSLYEVGPTHLAMGYIDGLNLAQRLQTPMKPSLALLIARQLASALSHAHRNGVVHRDVKPGNVLLDPRGTACLADFGLAIFADESGAGVSRGGTPGYMAPEQERERLVGPAADQYGLARTMLDMFSGGRALAATDQALEALPSGVREPLSEILRRALAERPEERWPSLSDFAERLAGVDLAGKPAPERLADERRSSEPYRWCSAPVSITEVSPRIACADYTLLGLVGSGVVQREALDCFIEETGYGDVGFTIYACTGRLGPLDAATLLSRASDLVVLLHGTANTRAVWHDVAIALCRDNAEAVVLVPDVFGFGQSPFATSRPKDGLLTPGALVAMIEAWRRLLGLSDFPTVLVGHSAAAAGLMSVTDERLGDHVSRVALTPVFPFASFALRLQLRLGSLLLRIFGWSKRLMAALSWLMIVHGPATSSYSRDERRAMQGALRGVPWYVMSRLSAELAEVRPAEGDRLERCAILVGKDDPLAPEEDVLSVLSDLGVPPRNIYKAASGGHGPHVAEDANPGWRMRNIDDIVRIVGSMLLSSREGASRSSSRRGSGRPAADLPTTQQ